MKYSLITVLLLTVSFIVNAQKSANSPFRFEAAVPLNLPLPNALKFNGYPSPVAKMQHDTIGSVVLIQPVIYKPVPIPCLVPDMSNVTRIPSFATLDVAPVVIPNMLIK